MKLTPWYPAHIKPVRVGVYEVHDHVNDSLQWYSYWNGNRFCYWVFSSIKHAVRLKNLKTKAIATHWRGVEK